VHDERRTPKEQGHVSILVVRYKEMSPTFPKDFKFPFTQLDYAELEKRILEAYDLSSISVMNELHAYTHTIRPRAQTAQSTRDSFHAKPNDGCIDIPKSDYTITDVEPENKLMTRKKELSFTECLFDAKRVLNAPWLKRKDYVQRGHDMQLPVEPIETINLRIPEITITTCTMRVNLYRVYFPEFSLSTYIAWAYCPHDHVFLYTYIPR
jgi:hypothetical protein